MPTATEPPVRRFPLLKVVLLVGAGLLLFTAIGIGATAAAIYRGGTIRVEPSLIDPDELFGEGGQPMSLTVCGTPVTLAPGDVDEVVELANDTDCRSPIS